MPPAKPTTSPRCPATLVRASTTSPTACPTTRLPLFPSRLVARQIHAQFPQLCTDVSASDLVRVRHRRSPPWSPSDISWTRLCRSCLSTSGMSWLVLVDGRLRVRAVPSARSRRSGAVRRCETSARDACRRHLCRYAPNRQIRSRSAGRTRKQRIHFGTTWRSSHVMTNSHTVRSNVVVDNTPPIWPNASLSTSKPCVPSVLRIGLARESAPPTA